MMQEIGTQGCLGQDFPWNMWIEKNENGKLSKTSKKYATWEDCNYHQHLQDTTQKWLESERKKMSQAQF